MADSVWSGRAVASSGACALAPWVPASTAPRGAGLSRPDPLPVRVPAARLRGRHPPALPFRPDLGLARRAAGRLPRRKRAPRRGARRRRRRSQDPLDVGQRLGLSLEAGDCALTLGNCLRDDTHGRWRVVVLRWGCQTRGGWAAEGLSRLAMSILGGGRRVCDGRSAHGWWQLVRGAAFAIRPVLPGGLLGKGRGNARRRRRAPSRGGVSIRDLVRHALPSPPRPRRSSGKCTGGDAADLLGANDAGRNQWDVKRLQRVTMCGGLVLVLLVVLAPVADHRAQRGRRPAPPWSSPSSTATPSAGGWPGRAVTPSG